MRYAYNFCPCGKSVPKWDTMQQKPIKMGHHVIQNPPKWDNMHATKSHQCGVPSHQTGTPWPWTPPKWEAMSQNPTKVGRHVTKLRQSGTPCHKNSPKWDTMSHKSNNLGHHVTTTHPRGKPCPSKRDISMSHKTNPNGTPRRKQNYQGGTPFQL